MCWWVQFELQDGSTLCSEMIASTRGSNGRAVAALRSASDRLPGERRVAAPISCFPPSPSVPWTVARLGTICCAFILSPVT